MELPKNITQIGETNQRCKIYVEDYVISYMKQLNHLARDKEMAVALYGIRKEDNDVSYFFLYGACKLNFLQKETRHLSQAQHQEIEKCRERYFRNYTFLGYRLLNGEMIEGFHLCEQGICRYIQGYAQFYEKNDSMLAYMLDVREEKAPEVVEQEKYDMVKKRQEERRALHEETVLYKPLSQGDSKGSGSLRGMRFAAVAVFALLCLVGFSSLMEEGTDLRLVAKQMLSSVMEQQIPDAVTEDTLIAEDKLAEAILKENEVLPVSGTAEVAVQETEADLAEPVQQEIVPTETTQPESVAIESEQAEIAQSEPAPTISETAEPEKEVGMVVEVVPEEVVPSAEPVSYTIKEGDTLIAISLREYGSDGKVQEICTLNQITNPDDIKVGQKILLP